MKKILLSLVALLCATMSFAQNQIATLSHGDEIKTFYGAYGFRDAMSAATHGDVITLSSGQFLATDITKAVTLRGAGMVAINDSIGFHAPTIIDGNSSSYLYIDIADSITNKLTIEGIKFNGNVDYKNYLKSPVFTKCNFYSLKYYNSDYNIKDAVLVNCRVRSFMYLGKASKISCINCVINNPSSSNCGVNSTYDFVNCVITGDLSGSSLFPYCSIRNCYLYTSYQYTTNLSSLCNVHNCCSNKSVIFINYPDVSNKIVSTSDMFKTFSGSWTDSEKFILKDDAASTYLGDDDTQIGLYGGIMPYEEFIALPRISKCKVAGKSTADGKLSVEIQVEAAQ